MKCSECDKPIPPTRLAAQPNVKTCSAPCSGIRQVSKGNKRSESYRRRVRRNLGEIEHVPLVQGTKPIVRRGHVVGRQPEGEWWWKLVAVVRATHKGKATHVCPVSSWGQQKATSATRLSGGKIAVLPPELAQDQRWVTASLDGLPFPDEKGLRHTLDTLARRRSSSDSAGQESGR